MRKPTRTATSLITTMAVLLLLCAFGFTALGADHLSQGGRGALVAAPQPPLSEFRQGVDGYEGCADTYISSWYPDVNFCSETELRVKADSPFRTLIRFDLSGIIPYGEVAAGYLELYVQGGDPIFGSLKAHKVRRDWNCEEATWRNAKQGERWGEDGCSHPDVDYYFDPEGNGYPSPDRPGFYRVEIDRQTLQSWLSNPSANKGLILIGEGGYDYFSFGSSEASLESRRPVLVIKWVPPTPTATPFVTPTHTPSPTVTPTATPLVVPTPQPAHLALIAYPTSLTVDETSVITATVTDSLSNPVPDGVVVRFTTTLGHFGGGITTTTRSTLGGTASVVLHSTETGTAIVRGSVGALSAEVAVTFAAGVPDNIVLMVSPGVIPGCGGTALAEALVTDRHGNPVRDGMVIAFDVTPQGDAEPIDGGRTTNGVASAIISSGTVPGPATVHAWWGPARTSVVAQFPVVFEVGPPDEVNLSAEPPNVRVGGNTATLRLQALDCAGYPVTDLTPVTFTLASGQGSLEPLVTTTVNGRAYSTLTSPNQTGSATIRATVGDREATVVVQYIPGRAFDVTLTADPLSIPADGVSTSTIVAEVRDSYGNAVADRTTVVFSTDLGRFDTGTSYVTSTTGGKASGVLTSSSTPGVARVEAVAGGKRVEIYVDFYWVPPPTPTPTPTPQWHLYLPIVFRRRGSGPFPGL